MVDLDFLKQEEADLRVSMTRAYNNMRAKLDAGEDATLARKYFHSKVEQHRSVVGMIAEQRGQVLDARKATNAELAKIMFDK